MSSAIDYFCYYMLTYTFSPVLRVSPHVVDQVLLPQRALYKDLPITSMYNREDCRDKLSTV